MDRIPERHCFTEGNGGATSSLQKQLLNVTETVQTSQSLNNRQEAAATGQEHCITVCDVPLTAVTAARAATSSHFSLISVEWSLSGTKLR